MQQAIAEEPVDRGVRGRSVMESEEDPSYRGPFDRVLRFSGQRRRVGRMWTQLWPVTNEKHKSDLAFPRSMTSGCISLLTDTTE